MFSWAARHGFSAVVVVRDSHPFPTARASKGQAPASSGFASFVFFGLNLRLRVLSVLL
jgi:hypothetical protein